MLIYAAMRRKTDYMFLRPGSRNWHIKLQSPTGRTEKSLGTPDRVRAEVLALPMIAEHKAALLAARPRVETTWHHKLAPGLHVSPDCQSAFKFDPRSASNFDPLWRRVLTVALAPSELVGVAETARARVVV